MVGISMLGWPFKCFGEKKGDLITNISFGELKTQHNDLDRASQDHMVQKVLRALIMNPQQASNVILFISSASLATIWPVYPKILFHTQYGRSLMYLHPPAPQHDESWYWLLPEQTAYKSWGQHICSIFLSFNVEPQLWHASLLTPESCGIRYVRLLDRRCTIRSGCRSNIGLGYRIGRRREGGGGGWGWTSWWLIEAGWRRRNDFCLIRKCRSLKYEGNMSPFYVHEMALVFTDPAIVAENPSILSTICMGSFNATPSNYSWVWEGVEVSLSGRQVLGWESLQE
jgi:hypothetical protein